MSDLILDILFLVGAYFVIGVIAVLVLFLYALAEETGPERDTGDVLTGCHADDRSEMVTRRFVSAEEIHRQVKEMRPPLYHHKSRLN